VMVVMVMVHQHPCCFPRMCDKHWCSLTSIASHIW
jgi:hypothetical protein